MSAWRALVLVVVVAPATAVAGCSLIVSTDGLTVPAAAPGTDGSISETSTVAEAGTDATVDAEAGALPFCDSLAPKPKFCADFDTGSLVDLGRVSGATPSIDSAVALSPPRSMLAVVETAATDRGSKILHDFADAPTSFVASFDVYFEEYDTTHDVELVTVQLKRGSPGSCIVNVAVRQSSWTLDETCEGTPTLAVAHRSPLSMKLSRWTHLEFSTDFALRTYSLSVDGAPTFANLPIETGLATGSITFGTGIAYLQANATRSKARFDNVVFDYK